MTTIISRRHFNRLCEQLARDISATIQADRHEDYAMRETLLDGTMEPA